MEMIQIAQPPEISGEIWHEKEFKFNAPHHFQVKQCDPSGLVKHFEVHFQEGPIPEVGYNGLTNEQLLAMVLVRLEHFQHSVYACNENANASMHILEGLSWLNTRTMKRKARGVEGTHTV